MPLSFEELDYRSTPMGDLALRRRTIPVLGNREVFEVTLGDAFLMSSLFHEVEEALADLALGPRSGPMEVVVGGLGLGYTAAAALRHAGVRSLVVIEVLEPVIHWHMRHLVPLGKLLTGDPRCHLLNGDFFRMAVDPESRPGFGAPGGGVDAILLDIDHSPTNLLSDAHAGFYTEDGLRKLARHLHPGGVFGMWSDDPPDDDFVRRLNQIFARGEARIVEFENVLRGTESASTVYLAWKESASGWSTGGRLSCSTPESAT